MGRNRTAVVIGSRTYSWDGNLTEDTLLRVMENGRQLETLCFSSHIAHTNGEILMKFAEAGVLPAG